MKIPKATLRYSAVQGLAWRMAKVIDHPNEPGKWALLERQGAISLWRRDRSDPFPVTQFYLLAAPRQTEVLYDEVQARALFADIAGRVAYQAA